MKDVLSLDLLIRAVGSSMVSILHQDGKDLSMRQFAVFLTCYNSAERHTVTDLAETLKVDPAVISRVLDRLGALGLTVRERNPNDRRSIFVGRTRKGTAFWRVLNEALDDNWNTGVDMARKSVPDAAWARG